MGEKAVSSLFFLLRERYFSRHLLGTSLMTIDGKIGGHCFFFLEIPGPTGGLGQYRLISGSRG